MKKLEQIEEKQKEERIPFSLELRMPVLPIHRACENCGATKIKPKIIHSNTMHGEKRFCSEACRNQWVYKQQEK